MLAAQDIITYLGASGAQYGALGGAGDFAGAADQLKVTKSVFVMPPTEEAQPSTTGTEVTRQRSKISVRLMLGFIVRTATGIDQSGDVDVLREALKTALVGWTLNDSVYAPMNFVGFRASSVSKDGFTVFYALDFTTWYILRAPMP
jgi:hypothetical protein